MNSPPGDKPLLRPRSGFNTGINPIKHGGVRSRIRRRVIGNELLRNIPNTRDLVWVDFTAYDIWPPE